jgi:ferritin-like metal-binding protein YciE
MSQLEASIIEELKSLYDAEKQLAKALPRFVKAAHNTELKHTLESYSDEIETQSDRLEQLFECFNEPVTATKCVGMQGLLSEADRHIKEHAGDAELICAFQKLKHYEIAAYGSLAAWATALGAKEACDILRQILEEEKLEDEKLSDIGETSANTEEAEAGLVRGGHDCESGISGRARKRSTGRKVYAAR